MSTKSIKENCSFHPGNIAIHIQNKSQDVRGNEVELVHDEVELGVKVAEDDVGRELCETQARAVTRTQDGVLHLRLRDQLLLAELVHRLVYNQDNLDLVTITLRPCQFQMKPFWQTWLSAR